MVRMRTNEHCKRSDRLQTNLNKWIQQSSLLEQSDQRKSPFNLNNIRPNLHINRIFWFICEFREKAGKYLGANTNE